ncbi:unnamed protein product [Coffea canephora]|uniref:MADS-box domain-containing protein n=1 Tax=Coffea canephora TaxID=49390 RepID=A0A068TZB5_COFCA|nr:unnamed protein product [Coffea canephora]
MGRVKLPISRIVNNTNRQVTFSKRRNGILKKAYELAVLCDIDIALFMVSPSGRISYFSGTKRIEDVMLQYFNLKDEERESDHDSEGIVHDKEVRQILICNDTYKFGRERTRSSNSNEYKQEIMNLQHQLEIAKEQLRQSSEERLSEALNLVEKRKRHLLTDHSSSYQETVEVSPQLFVVWLVVVFFVYDSACFWIPYRDIDDHFFLWIQSTSFNQCH